jgi:hypothetical protein
MATALTLMTKKNLRDTEGKLKENLARIEAALGVTGFSLEIIDLAKCAATAKDRDYENRIGEVVHDWYMTGLAGNIEKHCSDDMVRDAFRDALSKKKVTFRVDDKANSYHEEKFEDGCLAILVRPDTFASNVDSTGETLQELL